MYQGLNSGQGGATGRRSVVLGAAAMGATGLAARQGRAQSLKPFKIGLLTSFTKSFAVFGQSHLDGLNLWFEQNGVTVAGRSIEIVKEDDEINPQVGLQRLKKLVESDRVDVLIGPQASNVAMAMVDYVRVNKVLWICSGAGITDLTWNRIPYMFRTSTSAWQENSVFGEWYSKNIGAEAILAASDFAGGHSTVDEFRRSFERQGKVVKEMYPPLGTTDFSPYLADIQRTQAKGIYCFFVGSDGVRFVKQYAEYGLKERTKLCSSGFMVESDTLPAQGDAALGIANSLHYADTLDTPVNRKFVADYRARFKSYPSAVAEHGYVTGRVITEALKAVGGDTSDRNRLAAAVAATKFEAPRGPFSFDQASHNVIQNIYIREVAMVDGRLTNKVIGTVENVRDPAVKDA